MLMVDYVLMGAIAALVLFLLILRTNTAICFLALCAGSVLLDSSGHNMSLIASSLTSGISTSTNIIQIVLLFAPVFVLAVLMRKQVKKSLVPLGFVPAVCTALLAVIFVAPLLSDGLEGTILTTDTWEVLMQYQELIVGMGLVTSVIMIALTVRKPEEKHKKGKH